MNKLVVHHVGGRAGSRSFPVLPAFEDDIINVIYEADKNCLVQIEQHWTHINKNTSVIHACLFNREGTTSFNLNYDPYTSSIYEFNPRYDTWYYPGEYDYPFGDACKTVATLSMPVTTLDTIVREGKAPPPDFISLDTQGSELEILRGAPECMENILGIQIEVEFHQLYKYQPLFGEICDFLSDFDLVDIEILDRLRPIRAKEGFSGRGYVTHGEAVFLRKPETVLNKNKLAFLAVVFSQFELAQQCFSETKPMTGSFNVFINRLKGLVDKLPERKKQSFTTVYSVEKSHARFTSSTKTRQVPRSVASIIRMIQWLDNLRGQYNLLKVKWVTQWNARFNLSPVEKLFMEYGLEEQCRVLVENRCSPIG